MRQTVLNESLGDSVKITVIATGFQPENAPAVRRNQIVVESRPAVLQAAAAAAPAHREPAPEPAPVEYSAPEPPAPQPPAPAHRATPRPLPPPQQSGYDTDELDTPAYMRQGKLLN